jgi:hypothetical protein
MDAAGNFVVAWFDPKYSSSGGNGGDILAQRYTAKGQRDGTQFTVNADTSGTQQFPAVTMDAAGDFVVAWDDPDAGVFFRRYKADGDASSGDVHACTYKKSITPSPSARPAIASDASGDFVIAWTDYSGADGDGQGITVRRYSADGDEQGGSIQSNTHITGDQATPAAAMNAAGDFVVAWTDHSDDNGDRDRDDDGDGIFARRYARDTSLDLESILSAAPHDQVKPGTFITLTAGVENKEMPVTLTGDATINKALKSASGLTATLSFPDKVQFEKATGTNWSCPTKLTKNKLTCTYGSRLPAQDESENLTVEVKAPTKTDAKLAFVNDVFGAQPDAENTANNSSQITLAVKPDSSSGGSSSGGSSSGGSESSSSSSGGDGSGSSGSRDSSGGGGALGLLGLAVFGLIAFDRRRKA